MKAFVALAACMVPLISASAESKQPTAPETGLEFIDTSFENASPVFWEVGTNGVIHVSLMYDHQRSSMNRAAGHIHFQVQAKPGSKLTLEFHNLDNVWNGRPGSVARELKAVAISSDGRTWQSLATRSLPENRIQLDLEMTGPRLFVARLEPYRISDLDRLLAEIRPNPLVNIEEIGRTVEGRALEIVRVGDAAAPHRVFVRARAHPWESGGNWVVQGLIRRLLKGDADAKKYLGRYCLYILPMANKDGVARGRTRFNLAGWDLNREWDKPAPKEFAPENCALEQWLEAATGRGQRPDLALELHNDGFGKLHVSRPDVPDLEGYLAKMARFEKLLRQHTWFTEGSTGSSFRNPGSLGDQWFERFGIVAAVLELNANWIAGKEKMPLGADWEEFGAALARVFDAYFGG
ncbi:MAG TPA: M14 family zinc carboxypeptidase [Verrucomicrobiae bacterium]|nr:M14 family zinc carboxypeptidase [Verrucomicrobiae bacterium]